MQISNFTLYSAASKTYEKCCKVIPFNKQQRQRMYESCQLTKVSPLKTTDKKFSPFNTVSRSARDSYLLRVTKESVTQTNYQPNHEVTLKRNRRPTIDKGKFKRIIGPVQQNDFSVEVDEAKRDRRCNSACEPSGRKRPLTARETHSWRKNHQHMDFSKQVDPQRLSTKMKTQRNSCRSKETKQSEQFIQKVKNTTQSNFNNFKRFSLQIKTEKSHAFESDSGHEYLKAFKTKPSEGASHDILQSKEEILRKSFRRPIGEMRFKNFKDQIKTRVDRSDPHWGQSLEYQPDYKSIEVNSNKCIDFTQVLNRQINEVHNKYPIRQTLKPFVPMNKFK